MIYRKHLGTMADIMINIGYAFDVGQLFLKVICV